jgi:hypothetical protein
VSAFSAFKGRVDDQGRASPPRAEICCASV